MCDKNLLRISLPKMFAKKNKKLIGRLKKDKSGGFLDFRNNIIVEHFQSNG